MVKGGKNDTKTNSAKSATAVTPPRKSTLGNNRSPPKSIKKSHQNQIKCYVPAPDIAIVRFTKPDGNQPAFLKPTLQALEEDDEKKDLCKIVFMTELRDPSGNNCALINTSSTGKEYTHDVMVVNLMGEAPKVVMSSLATAINDMTSQVKTMYQFGAPKFNNGGILKCENRPLSYYLMNDDCISLMKRFYEGTDIKDDFMENENRDAILTEVFGDKEHGMEVLNEIDDEEWELNY